MTSEIKRIIRPDIQSSRMFSGQTTYPFIFGTQRVIGRASQLLSKIRRGETVEGRLFSSSDPISEFAGRLILIVISTYLGPTSESVFHS